MMASRCPPLPQKQRAQHYGLRTPLKYGRLSLSKRFGRLSRHLLPPSAHS